MHFQHVYLSKYESCYQKNFLITTCEEVTSDHSFEFGHSILSGFFPIFISLLMLIRILILILKCDQVKVMDTVGCGDSFVAAIAFGFIHNIPLVTTLVFANAVGAATAMGCGAGRNVATLKQVVELMEAPDLNEDDEFWNELLGEHLDTRFLFSHEWF